MTGASLCCREPGATRVTGSRRGKTGGEVAVDLLTKTGPISGAVWAREVKRLHADAEAFTSLQAVRNKAHLLVTASLLPNAEERVREQEEEEWGRVVKVVPFDHVREDRTQDRRLLMNILIFTISK